MSGKGRDFAQVSFVPICGRDFVALVEPIILHTYEQFVFEPIDLPIFETNFEVSVTVFDEEFNYVQELVYHSLGSEEWLLKCLDTHPLLIRTYQDLHDFILRILESIASTSKKGFIDTDVSKMKIINRFLLSFLIRDSETHKFDNEFISGKHCVTSYKWIINQLLFDLYYVSLLLRGKVYGRSDLAADLRVLSEKLHDLLEPSIRLFVQRRGVSVTQHIIAALDTEYVNQDEKTNKLVSIQLAGRTVSYLRIPLIEPWDYYTIHTLTGKRYEIKNQGKASFDYTKVGVNINSILDAVRALRYGFLIYRWSNSWIE